MKNIHLIILSSIALAADLSNLHADLSPSSSVTNSMSVGINISGVADWTTSQTFIDLFKCFRSWQTHNAVDMGTNSSGRNLNAWATGLQQYIPTDINGWPTQVPFSQTVVPNGGSDPNNPGSLLSTLQQVQTIVRFEIPGVYRLRFYGTGTFVIIGQSNSKQYGETFTPARISTLPTDADGKHYWDTPYNDAKPDAQNAPAGVFAFNIMQSSGSDYLRDFELIAPGYANTDYTNSPFMPQFTSTLSGFKTIRMMNWVNSGIDTWNHRTRPSTYTQTVAGGVALEYMVMLCNQVGANLWITVPYQASEDYVRNSARLILNGSKSDGTPFNPGTDDPSLLAYPPLNPTLKVYVEYSNETWNPSFPQTGYCTQQGIALRAKGLPVDPSDNYSAGSQFAAYQSANIWDWFYQEWGAVAPQRIIRVLGGGMGANYDDIRLGAFRIPGLITVKQYPDVLAIAPYFGSGVADAIGNSGQLATTDQILQAASNDLITNVIPSVKAIKSVTDKYGVWLNCYEAGQGLVASSYGNIMNTNLTASLIAANQSPGMGSLYQAYMTQLASTGVIEMASFAHIGQSGIYGSWNVIEYLGQSLSGCYKYQALLDWIGSHTNPPSIPPIIAIDCPSAPIDTTGSGSASLSLSSAASVDYFGTVATNSWIVNGTNSYTDSTISLNLPVGLNSVLLSETNNRGIGASQTLQIAVRPYGSDGILVQSDFTGASPGLHTPWNKTSQLSSGINFGGWTFGTHNSLAGVWSGDPINNLFGVDLVANYYSSILGLRATLSDAISSNQYLSCTITPISGKTLDLRGAYLEWTMQNITGNAEQQCAMATSVGGFNTNSVIYQTPTFNKFDHWSNPELDTFGTYLPFTVDYSNITTPVEIRIYLFGNIWSGKPTYLSSFKLTGAVN